MTTHDDHSREEIYELKFPDDLYGAAIDGIDLTILSLDSIRLIEAYAKQEGLSEIQRQVLRQCDEELQVVISKLEGRGKKYFQRLEREIHRIIKGA